MSFAEIIPPSRDDTNLHAATAMASNEKTSSPIARISNKIDFLVCNSCFWCASYLNLRSSFIVVQCPLCKENAIEWIPISANDAYSFDYNPVTGVIVEFSNRNKISG